MERFDEMSRQMVKFHPDWRLNLKIKAFFYQVFFVCFFLVASGALANSPSDSNSHWKSNDPTNTKKVDHQAWQKFLAKYIDTSAADGINRVRYGAVSTEDKKSLNQYLSYMQGVTVSSLNRNEQMAFWINLYNARTVDLILEKYPVASIRDIHLSINPLNVGPWDAELLQVENRKLSLNDIEHRILRPLWKDNRVHFALNCASIGCPNLSNLAFSSENLKTMLDQGAEAFINSPRGVRLDGQSLILSSIFNWYGGDFGSNQSQLVDFLIRYSKSALKKNLENFNGKVQFQYDWKLNESKSNKG